MAGASLIALTVPAVAGAHVRIGTLAVDVQARVTSPRRSIQGAFTVSVSQGDRALHVTVRRGHRLVVLGYLGEPVLRVDGQGVTVNRASPTAAGLQARSDHVDSRTAVWRDPRLQRLPHGVRKANWVVPILVDGRATRISGDLRRVSSPALWPWGLVVLGSASLAGLAAIKRRRRHVEVLCAVLGGIAAAVGIVAAGGFAFTAAAAGMRVAAVYEFVLAAGGVGFAVWGPPEVRVGAAGWLGLLGLVSGLACGQVFVHGDVLSTLPGTFTRTAAALAIGLGAAASVLTGLYYASLPDLTSSPT
ncbi:MAG: hypothetical protein ACTHKS_18555 [Gaiellaceae bacterium]